MGLQGVELGQGGFFDTNMLVSPTQNGHVGGLNRHDSPTRVGSRCSEI